MERKDYYFSKVATHLASKIHDRVNSAALKSAIGISVSDEYIHHQVEFFNQIGARLHEYYKQGALGRFKQNDVFSYYLTSMSDHPSLVGLIEKERVRLDALVNDPNRPKPMAENVQDLCKDALQRNSVVFSKLCANITHYTDMTEFDVQTLFVMVLDADPLLLDCPQMKQAAQMVVQNIVNEFPGLKNDIQNHWQSMFNEQLKPLVDPASLDALQSVMNEHGWSADIYGYKKDVESLSGSPMYVHVSTMPTGTIKLQGEFISEGSNALVKNTFNCLRDTPQEMIDSFIKGVEATVEQSYSVRCAPSSKPAATAPSPSR